MEQEDLCETAIIKSKKVTRNKKKNYNNNLIQYFAFLLGKTFLDIWDYICLTTFPLISKMLYSTWWLEWCPCSGLSPKMWKQAHTPVALLGDLRSQLPSPPSSSVVLGLSTAFYGETLRALPHRGLWLWDTVTTA